MFRVRVSALNLLCRLQEFYVNKRGLKVAVVGAGNEVGQPLCLLLKQSPWFKTISIFDEKSGLSLADELSHIDTRSTVTASKTLAKAIEGAAIVLCVAGTTAKPDISKSQLMESNYSVVGETARACALCAPKALLGVASEPTNMLLPVAVEVTKKIKRSDVISNVLGITTLNAVRCSTLISEMLQIDPDCVEVPVIGGFSGATAVPLLSQCKPCWDLTLEETVRVTRSVQEAGDYVKKPGQEESTSALSSAAAVAKFAVSLAKAIQGAEEITECALVASKVLPDTPYLATPLKLGPGGVERNLGLPELSQYETCLLQAALPLLRQDIQESLSFTSQIFRQLKIKEVVPC